MRPELPARPRICCACSYRSLHEVVSRDIRFLGHSPAGLNHPQGHPVCPCAIGRLLPCQPCLSPVQGLPGLCFGLQVAVSTWHNSSCVHTGDNIGSAVHSESRKCCFSMTATQGLCPLQTSLPCQHIPARLIWLGPANSTQKRAKDQTPGGEAWPFAVRKDGCGRQRERACRNRSYEG